MKVLALDFGGSSVKYGIVDDNAKIEESGKVPAPLSSVEAFTDTVKELYGKYRGKVSGIGISLPGNIDPESGVLIGSGVYQKLYGLSVTDLVKEACEVPVTIENDGKCGALSEAWKGALKDCKDGVVIILGSGIAGGLIKDRKIHSGKNFNAGELSYMVTSPGDYSLLSSSCMAVGMLGVTYKLCKMKNLDLSFQDSSETQIYLDSLFASRFPAPNGEPKKIKADGKQFFDWVNEGDSDALQVYKEFMTAFGSFVFNVQICYAPERIVIGGGLSREERIIPDLIAETDKYCEGYGIGDMMRPEIVRSAYLGESNLYGATYNFIIRNS